MRLTEKCGCGARFDLSTGGFGETSMTAEKIEGLVREWRTHHRHTEVVVLEGVSLTRADDESPWEVTYEQA